MIIEGLNLCSVPPGYYEPIALSIKLKGADGVPARVVARTEALRTSLFELNRHARFRMILYIKLKVILY